jgi:hypothetical protein
MPLGIKMGIIGGPTTQLFAHEDVSNAGRSQSAFQGLTVEVVCEAGIGVRPDVCQECHFVLLEELGKALLAVI